jgi:hypothetical protein
MRRSILALVATLGLVGCGGSESGPLTPARNLVGTWRTAIPPTVYFDTDFCSSSLSLVGSQTWDVTWVVTPGADDNTVNVEMGFGASNWRQIAGCPGSGVVPEVSPISFTGNVSSSSLTLRSGTDPAGTFAFTTDVIQGDLDTTWCMAYCQREYTTDRTLILLRQ